MSLITRAGKGSRLTISEMDSNLVHLNNNPLLLGKITADLTLPVESKIILITDDERLKKAINLHLSQNIKTLDDRFNKLYKF